MLAIGIGIMIFLAVKSLGKRDSGKRGKKRWMKILVYGQEVKMKVMMRTVLIKVEIDLTKIYGR
jgi:hypothetical protein